MATRFDSIKFDEQSTKEHNCLKGKFEELEIFIGSVLAPSVTRDIVLLKLEESFAFVGKSIRDNQINRELIFTIDNVISIKE